MVDISKWGDGVRLSVLPECIYMYKIAGGLRAGVCLIPLRNGTVGTDNVYHRLAPSWDDSHGSDRISCRIWISTQAGKFTNGPSPSAKRKINLLAKSNSRMWTQRFHIFPSGDPPVHRNKVIQLNERTCTSTCLKTKQYLTMWSCKIVGPHRNRLPYLHDIVNNLWWNSVPASAATAAAAAEAAASTSGKQKSILTARPCFESTVQHLVNLEGDEANGRMIHISDRHGLSKRDRGRGRLLGI